MTITLVDYDTYIGLSPENQMIQRLQAMGQVATAAGWDPLTPAEMRASFERKPSVDGEGGRSWALDRLGLPEHAGISDIEAAYDRLTALYDPDRLRALGTSAETMIDAANRLNGIHRAYDVLKKVAEEKPSRNLSSAF